MSTTNPHAQVAQYGQLEFQERQIEATLAVAYEQRTANLIALALASTTVQIAGVDYSKLANTIKERLGLDV